MGGGGGVGWEGGAHRLELVSHFDDEDFTRQRLRSYCLVVVATVT